jgi:hypothetical protein
MNAHAAASPDHQHSFWRPQLRAFPQDMHRRGDSVGRNRSVHVADLRWEVAQVTGRQFDILGQTTIDLPTDYAPLIFAQIVASPITPPTVATNQIVVDIDAIPYLETLDIWAYLHHIASDFVADSAG